MEQTLTLSRQFSFKACRLRLQADFINFMNEQYEVIKYYPMPGRSWKITAAIHFKFKYLCNLENYFQFVLHGGIRGVTGSL